MTTYMSMDVNTIRNNSNIRLFDTDIQTGLQLWSYSHCNDDSSESVKQCRGVVLDGDKIVSRMFGYTKEYTENDEDLIRAELSLYEGQIYAVPAMEGTIIRLFHSHNRWFLSTFRKLDAYNSRWGSDKTFGELFQQALYNEFTHYNPKFREVVGEVEDPSHLFDHFCSILDVNNTYTFLLQTTSETRQVCKGENPQRMWFMGLFDKDGVFDPMCDIFITAPFERIRNTTSEIVMARVKITDITMHQGLMVYLPNNTQIKITHSSYAELQKVRGNTPSILSRYMEVHGDEETKNMLRTMYPERVWQFNTIDANIKAVCGYIHRVYIGRYIKKQYIFVHPLLNYLLKELHTKYIQNREPVTLSVVEAFISRQPGKIISQLDQVTY